MSVLSVLRHKGLVNPKVTAKLNTQGTKLLNIAKWTGTFLQIILLKKYESYKSEKSAIKKSVEKTPVEHFVCF